MGAVPLTVLVLGIINFVRALSRRGTIILQALVSLVLWMVLTYAIVLIFFMIVFSQKYPVSPTDELKTTAGAILATVIYAAAGVALIYWTKRQAKLSQVAKFAG
jgi:predicted cobalt transporter CbtA